MVVKADNYRKPFIIYSVKKKIFFCFDGAKLVLFLIILNKNKKNFTYLLILYLIDVIFVNDRFTKFVSLI